MRISQKEKILLGYDPSSSPKTPSRSSDIDFSDVFGGLPRRASLQEMQHRSSDDSYGDGNEEIVPGRSSWSNNPGEKPVFGSEIVSRRRYQSQDFFDDIFRGDQSQSSSPRIGGRDPMSSAPGSGVLSPARPLPPGAVPLGSPVQFSLPARLATSHSSSNLSRLSGQGHDDAFSPYRRSHLSQKASGNGEELKKEDNVDGSGGGKQATNGSNQFHFSIHKWASKGVPLVMSLGKRNSLRSKIMLERSASLNDNAESDTLVGEIQPVGVNTDDLVSFKVHVVPSAKESKESEQVVDKSEIKSEENVSNLGVDASISDIKPSSKKLHGVEGRRNDYAIPEVKISKRAMDNKSGASSVVEKKEYNEDVGKFKLKEQSSLKGDNKSNNNRHQKNLGNDTAKERVKKTIGNDGVRDEVKGAIGKDGAKGKVKEFVKIFNQEPAIKTVADIGGKSPSGRWRNTDMSRAKSANSKSTSDSSPKVDENYTQSSGIQFEANNVQDPHESSSVENENLGSTMGSASDGLKASSENIDVAFDSILIEELPHIQNKPYENSENDEDMQAYESKILKWSKGKEGNIRVLLSTLQYVLWPNSGWKPVPLVDIIEANAVKRSYQRALLYLHPDKLQQKGAASHQKFIAEKVFDVLQEAWDHFNTTGSL